MKETLQGLIALAAIPAVIALAITFDLCMHC
jgi:hypothetical protein